MVYVFSVFFLLLLFSFPIIVVWAYKSRRSKQKKIMASLPSSVTYMAAVRINTDRGNARIMKLKAFEYTGVMYVDGNKIFIKGSNGQSLEFDLLYTQLVWEGVHAQNGLLEWFSLRDSEGKKYFVNAETGLFVFAVSKHLPSTQVIYQNFLSEQALAQSKANTPPVMPFTPPPIPSV